LKNTNICVGVVPELITHENILVEVVSLLCELINVILSVSLLQSCWPTTKHYTTPSKSSLTIHISLRCLRVTAPSRIISEIAITLLFGSDHTLRQNQKYPNQIIYPNMFAELRRIKCYGRLLQLNAARTLVNSLVLSKIDYCNCLLAPAPKTIHNKLQNVMNAAARIVGGLQKFDHITNHMRDTLHWFQVPQRVKFKLCLLTYKALHGLAPNYMSELCTPVVSVDLRTTCVLPLLGIWSFLEQQHHLPTAFASAGPRAWNSLPSNIKSADSVSSFTRQLKTHLFAECYGQS